VNNPLSASILFSLLAAFPTSQPNHPFFANLVREEIGANCWFRQDPTYHACAMAVASSASPVRQLVVQRVWPGQTREE
jgi:hypothetical protein